MTYALIMIRMEHALNVIKDIVLKVMHVLEILFKDLLTLAARPGIGIIKNVSSARLDGCSTLTESAYLLTISVPPTTMTEPAPNATRDTTLKMELVSLTMSLVLLILVARLGIGITKFAWNALKDGFSMLMESAFPSMTSVPLITKKVPALNAIKLILLLMELVSEMNQLVLLILVARPGIGITKSVLNALKDGSSTLMESASQLMISADLTMMLELVLNATRDILLWMELV